MSRFIDEYLPSCAPGYPCYSTPRWSTDIVTVDSGAEQANQRWANVLNRFTLPEAVRNMTTFNGVRDHWLVMRGPYHIWPFRDPLDFASVPLVRPNEAPTISAADESLGTGDDVTTQFQLYRTYTVGAQTYRRKIELPLTDTVVVGYTIPPIPFDQNYVLPSWTVSRPGGVITFSEPVAAGVVMTCGYLFDVPVRFEDDESFDGILRSLHVAGFADITLLETRVC